MNCFEVLGFGITAAYLPPLHRMPLDMEELGQFYLRQVHRCPQGRHDLTEGIVSFSVGMGTHQHVLLA